MPSPFPGMDPYLESHHYWSGFHNEFLVYLNAALNRALPEGLVSRTQERCYVLPAEREIVPDALIVPTLRSVRAATLAPTERGAPTGSVIAYPQEHREAFIEIRAARSDEEVVTVIELVSPANKEQPGRDLYVRKQIDLLESRTNLVELDLLRAGKHLVAAPRELLLPFGPWDYLISLHRPARRYHYDFYSFTLRDLLPEVRIPLSPGLSDVLLSLQDIFTLCYDSGGYARAIDYSQTPDSKLSSEDLLWANALKS